jgi:uncharacterized protein (TIGR02466 family)|tara:strand:+ start:306 stop:929 length:624 start_codon:yes stop_codon:yes gene_type:complete
MQILPLFPSNLVVNEVDSKFNTIDIKNINFNNSGKSGQSAEQSNSLYVINDYQELGIEILKIFQQYTFNILKLSNDFTISTSWFTRMKPGDTCSMHQHHNCFYSGLYYFDDYEYNSGNIRFFDPLIRFSNFFMVSNSNNPTDFNLQNSKTWDIQPKKNMLIFFPSYLDHSILDNESKKSRHSLAFNLIPIGKYGSSDSTYNTEWFKS